MLKKCLKHEWKACWKNMALLNGAAIFMGALGGFGFLFSQISDRRNAHHPNCSQNNSNATINKDVGDT